VGKDAEWGSLLEKPPLRHADDTDSATLSHAVDIFVERHHLLWKVCFNPSLILLSPTHLYRFPFLSFPFLSFPFLSFPFPSLKNAHDAPFIMALPSILLAFGRIAVGYLGIQIARLCSVPSSFARQPETGTILPLGSHLHPPALPPLPFSLSPNPSPNTPTPSLTSKQRGARGVFCMTVSFLYACA